MANTHKATAADIQALKAFAARHGRYWKRTLSDMWMNGRDENEPNGAALRDIRNRLGPSWLHNFRLLKEA